MPFKRHAYRGAELSQHFLRSTRTIDRIVTICNLPLNEPVLEIGAGDGALTRALADRGYSVVAIEKDPRLVSVLARRFADEPRVRVDRADALAYGLPAFPYNVVSNVPFSVTSALVRRVLNAPVPPGEACLIVERGAAHRFAGVPDETLFSLSYKPVFDFDIAWRLRRADFAPRPRVATALLRIRRRAPPLIDPRDLPRYRRFVAAAFGRGDVKHALRHWFTARHIARLSRDLRFPLDAHVSQLHIGHWLALFRFHRHTAMGRDPTTCGFPLPAPLPTMSRFEGGRHGAGAIAHRR